MNYKAIIWSSETDNPGVPDWWIKFYEQVGKKPITYMYKILEENHAKYVSADKSIYIEFEDERYYSMFLLRYS